MSATGRGPRGGGGTDYFPTPPTCVRQLLAACELPGGRWLEPSAGDGSIIRTVNAARTDVTWRAVELRGDFLSPLLSAVSAHRSGEVSIGDFLAPEVWRDGSQRFDVVVGNPPFSLADRFVGGCLQRAPVVAFLLRLSILGTQKRAEFWQRHPADVYVLSERPDFTGEGGDMAEYAWFVWGQCGAGPGRVRVLGPAGQIPLFSSG